MNEHRAPSPCQACPWRTANHGKRHPDGWYTKANARRLWAKLRTGDSMSCHPTDPRNPVSDKAKEAGYREAPGHAEVHECIGAIILQEREVMALQASKDLATYRRTRTRGMTTEGLWTIASRAVFGGTMLVREIARPNLNEPVSVPDAPALTWPLSGQS